MRENNWTKQTDGSFVTQFCNSEIILSPSWESYIIRVDDKFVGIMPTATDTNAIPRASLALEYSVFNHPTQKFVLSHTLSNCIETMVSFVYYGNLIRIEGGSSSAGGDYFSIFVDNKQKECQRVYKGLHYSNLYNAIEIAKRYVDYNLGEV